MRPLSLQADALLHRGISERPFAFSPLFGVTLTATEEKAQFSGHLFVHISVDGTAVSIQRAGGHFNGSWVVISHQRCHGNRFCDTEAAKRLLDNMSP